ncbi:MAG: hypothetical protein NC396_05700 [Bacteroides sp.]|nr:hypothetical protein [Bacteroides sp.]MCM1085849.1 hypothetical protein [Bacteroides sp.]
MTKPASKESIQRLCEDMNKIILSSFNLLHGTLYTYSKLEQIAEENKDRLFAIDAYKNLLELYTYLLYGNIVLSVFLRASLRSISSVEKRFNLKNIVFLTTELYKAINGKKGIWKKIQNAFTSDTEKSYIEDIEYKLEKFSRKYCTIDDKAYRDLAVHYDKNSIKVYEFFDFLSEDYECKRVSAFLEITNAYSNLVARRTRTIVEVDGNTNERFTIKNEMILGDVSGKMYSSLGDQITTMGQRLNEIQRLYSLPKAVEARLGVGGVSEQMSDFLQVAYLGIHIHFLYLDMAIAIRAYLSSESSIEKAIHLARLNLITYEGVRKIYRNDTDSFWRKYIVEIISPKDLISQREVKDLETLLSFTSENEFLFDEEFRHNYAHIRGGKINRLPLLLNRMQQLDALSELKRPLLLLRVLPRIMQLHKTALMTEEKKFDTKLKIQQHKSMQDFEVLINKLPLNEIQRMNLLKKIESIKALISKICNQ